MEKEFASYNQALRLKALGFDEPCFGYYYNKQLSFGARTSYGEVIEAPTFSQAFRWFKEKYKLFSAILPFQDIEDNVKLCYYYCVIDLDECQDEDILCNESSLGASDINFSSHEEAELACLDKLIEIVETKSE